MKKFYPISAAIVINFFVTFCIAQAPPPPVCIPCINQYNIIRPLYEININTTANVYPYISPDGLRIYFSQGIDANQFDEKYENLWVASRTNLSSNFGNKQLVSNLFPDSVRSCWLTNNELEIYYISGNLSNATHSRLFHATRTSLTNPFSAPQEVALNGMVYTKTWNALIGPSLTPDKSELYLYNTVYTSPNYTYSILRFTRQTDNSFTLVDTLARDILKVPTAGQLSKDGKSFFLGYIDNAGDSLKLCVLTRDTTIVPFSSTSFMVLNGTVNKSYYFNWLPSVSSDYNTIAFVREFSGGWEGNLLYLTTDSSVANGIKSLIKASNFQVTVFPNPVTDHIVFRANKSIQNETITLYNVFGEEVRRIENINAIETTVSREGLNSGIYFYTVSTNNISLASGKIIIE